MSSSCGSSCLVRLRRSRQKVVRAITVESFNLNRAQREQSHPDVADNTTDVALSPTRHRERRGPLRYRGTLLVTRSFYPTRDRRTRRRQPQQQQQLRRQDQPSRSLLHRHSRRYPVADPRRGRFVRFGRTPSSIPSVYITAVY